MWKELDHLDQTIDFDHEEGHHVETISETLSGLGGGFGFFGHELRDMKGWGYLADKALMELMVTNKLIFPYTVWGDSRYARHDSDSLVGMIMDRQIRNYRQLKEAMETKINASLERLDLEHDPETLAYYLEKSLRYHCQKEMVYLS